MRHKLRHLMSYIDSIYIYIYIPCYISWVHLTSPLQGVVFLEVRRVESS